MQPTMEDGTVLRITFDAQFRVEGQPAVCTEGSITLHDDGTWLLRISHPSAATPIIDLAGQASTPSGVITETIRAAITTAPDRTRPT